MDNADNEISIPLLNDQQEETEERQYKPLVRSKTMTLDSGLKSSNILKSPDKPRDPKISIKDRNTHEKFQIVNKAPTESRKPFQLK